MSLYKKIWWKKWWGKEGHKEKTIDTIKDIEAITEFLKGINADTAKLIQQLEELEELEKERQVASAGVLHINLEAQAALLDKILEQYEFFQNDVDINGLRIKMIAKQFLKEAEKAGMKDLVKEKKKNQKWQFWW